MAEVARNYAGVRARVAELIRDPRDAAVAVPTCPGWTVHDVLAHLTGVVTDVLAGRIEGIATEPWTLAQVEARRGRTIGELLEEWETRAPAFEELLEAVGPRGHQAVTDAVTHEHDIRTALDRPGARDTDAVLMAFEFVGPAFVEEAAGRGVIVRLAADGAADQGSSDAELVLDGTPFELLRALTGRRSVDQIRAMGWSGDCGPALAAFVFGPFRPSPTSIDE